MEIANQEQAAAWNGNDGAHWTANAERYDTTSSSTRPRVLDAAALDGAEQVIDIGCGSGRMTIEAARRLTSGSVLGVDLSGPLLALARERTAAEGLTNVSFEQGDAQVHRFEPAGADVAISHHGCMFFGDPVAAYTNIGQGLRPGGRLALLAWQDIRRNEWLMTLRGALAQGRDLGFPPPDAPTPFSLADPDRVRTILGAAGFDAVDFEAVDEPMVLGSDADDAFGFFSTVGLVKGLLDDLDEAQRAQALDDLRTAFKEAETARGVLLGTSSWLISATKR